MRNKHGFKEGMVLQALFCKHYANAYTGIICPIAYFYVVFFEGLYQYLIGNDTTPCPTMPATR